MAVDGQPGVSQAAAPGLRDPDGFYAALLAQQAGMEPIDALRFCARLILLLANEVGDDQRLRALLQAAGASDLSRRS